MLWLEKTVVFSTSGCATTQKSNTKMKEKQLYEAPWAQTFVVQAEGMICQSDLFNETDPGIAGLELTLEDDFIYNL